MRKTREVCGHLTSLMAGDGENPDHRASFGLTGLIAQKGMATRLFGLTPEEIGEIFSYRASEENQRKHRRELEKVLKETFGDDVAEANAEWDTHFPDWEAAIAAVVANKVEDAREIRRAVYGLTPRLALVCQTPNLLLIPLADPLSLRGESDANGALRKVVIELVLGLALDCAVAVVGDSEPLAVPEAHGIAWIPPVGPTRRLLGDLLERLERRQEAARLDRQVAQRLRLATADWIPLQYAEKLFRAIGAATIVASDTNFSERSHIYQVLTAPTVGHVLRRLEQQSSSGMAAAYHFPNLRILEEILT
jgi:hypothetical protein